MPTITVSPGVLSLLSTARTSDGSVGFLFTGDLNQMAKQEEFLRKRGFRVQRNGVYPGVCTDEEFKNALKAIWEAEVEGWWHYMEKYVKYKICTEEAFRKALDAYCERLQNTRR